VFDRPHSPDSAERDGPGRRVGDGVGHQRGCHGADRAGHWHKQCRQCAGLKENVRDYYLGATDCPGSSAFSCSLVGVPYPASLWPLVNTTATGGSFDTYGDSVADGVAQLNSQVFETLTNTEGPVVIFGFSQGANVVSNELRNLATLDQGTKYRLQVVVAGNTNRPNGGIWTRLGPLGYIPILDIPLGKPTPNDIGIQTTDIAYEYDPVGDAPLYPINLLADVNALFGLVYIHTTYIAPNGNTAPNVLPDGYTSEELAAQLDPMLHPENFQY
jgi:PE-PPE domain-containing protein